MRTIFKESQIQIQKNIYMLKKKKTQNVLCLNSHPLIQGSQKRKHSCMPVMHKTIKVLLFLSLPKFLPYLSIYKFWPKGEGEGEGEIQTKLSILHTFYRLECLHTMSIWQYKILYITSWLIMCLSILQVVNWLTVTKIVMWDQNCSCAIWTS